jgi:hypothetical protein
MRLGIADSDRMCRSEAVSRVVQTNCFEQLNRLGDSGILTTLNQGRRETDAGFVI